MPIKIEDGPEICQSWLSVDNLLVKLKAIAETRGGNDARIYVRGDKNVNYGTMMQIMGRLSGAGFHRVALVTEYEQETKAR